MKQEMAFKLPYGLPISIEDPHMAKAIADITVNWGNIERANFLLLKQ